MTEAVVAHSAVGAAAKDQLNVCIIEEKIARHTKRLGVVDRQTVGPHHVDVVRSVVRENIVGDDARSSTQFQRGIAGKIAEYRSGYAKSLTVKS